MTIMVSFDPATGNLRRYDSKAKRIKLRAGIEPSPRMTHRAHLLPTATVTAEQAVRHMYYNPFEDHAI